MQFRFQLFKNRAGYISLCRAFPEFTASAADEKAVLRLSVKNLSSLIASRLSNGIYIDDSIGTDNGGAFVRYPTYIWKPPLGIRLKIALSNGIIDKGWTRRRFAETMDITWPSLNNLFDIHISTRIATYDRAFDLLGLHPHLEIRTVASDDPFRNSRL
ncbi:hypothetical protein [Salinicola rhizosphaerae]|uniref:Uncharacterized protein n=1 Tax=Salinicola rhizosphaerae TaxID=1443141 RepID=A0ABQ3EJB6_9GAMM|nr:hypothetical protein [Salinicola rhizosphaerae]GHB34193.1 hypothetical protein GCM10009038_36580 [Salinicola rhizosphaerae]